MIKVIKFAILKIALHIWIYQSREREMKAVDILHAHNAPA
jgi:hypothetical protein